MPRGEVAELMAEHCKVGLRGRARADLAVDEQRPHPRPSLACIGARQDRTRPWITTNLVLGKEP